MSSSQQNYQNLLDTSLSSACASIERLDKDELNAILNDDEKLDQIINELPQMRSIITEREMLLAQNKSLAEWNLSQEPKMREAKERLVETYESAAAVKDEVTKLKQQLDNLCEQRSLDSTLALLRAAAQEAEDESEAVAEKFVDGEMEVDDFLQQFFPKRSLAHSRKIKAEKMSEVLRSQQLPAPARSAPPPPAHRQPYWPQYNTPYPAM